MKRLLLSLAVIAFALSAMRCTAPKAVEPSKYQLITDFATPETQQLFEKLASLQGKTMLIGQQSALTRSRQKSAGVEDATCDMLTSVGDYPAVFGFDVAWGCSRIIPEIMEAVEMGGIITLACHYPNPDSPEGESNAFRTKYGDDVKKILPDGENHEWLVARLDSVANLASQITHEGKRVPIIFRPWHEHTGGWFWWGCDTSTPDEFNALWRFTVEYLRDVKRVDNFIYAFSPSMNQNQTDYLDRNPGAEYMDIVGFDCYSFDGEEHEAHFSNACEIVSSYALEHNKVPACTEFGFQRCMANSNNPKWYTEGVLNPIKKSTLASGIVYALTWANFDEKQWWIPLPGDATYDDFVEFYDDPYTGFLNEWSEINK